MLMWHPASEGPPAEVSDEAFDFWQTLGWQRVEDDSPPPKEKATTKAKAKRASPTRTSHHS